MATDGIWSARGGDERPAPLALAAEVLGQALAGLGEPAALSAAAAQADGWLLLRAELTVAGPGPQASLLLDWLAAQGGAPPRTFFAARDSAELLAGCGAAHVCHVACGSGASGAPEQDMLLPHLSPLTHESIRYVGGVRFDASDFENARSAPAPEWAPFGASYWVLPRVQLSVSPSMREALADANDNASSPNSASLDGSSAASTATSPCLFSGRGRTACAVFAVHLRWRPTLVGTTGADAHSWSAELGRAREALSRLRGSETHAPLRSCCARRSEDATPEDFAARIDEALNAFATGELQKVVLARRVLLELAYAADPVNLLKQVVGSGQKRSYLFLLEPEAGAAFLSLTPERLCRVHRRDVWTEAVAGTWSLEEFERIGESALLGSSEKHCSEHQLVVDYICGLLSKVSEHVKVCDTHILKLKHLVHIKQSYHAIAKEDAQTPIDLARWFCSEMSPTPAVAGLPLSSARRFIRRAEAFDRGLYAAPCGLIGSGGAELVVALRSALVRGGKHVHVYAGAGIVPGSKAEEEFAEINLKMKQFTDAFASVPAGGPTPRMRLEALVALPNLNTLWASLVIEELVRNNVRSFVICPGSRSTPLVIAVARHPDTRYVMHHDERGAAYHALGWAKGSGAPVAIIVTSGTAVANLLPGVVEASTAWVPLVVLSADRPAELRDTGSNQTIVQPGIFGPNVRWAKDFPSPSVEYPAHALLGDIDLAYAHAEGQLTGQPGPVHLNFCFRENLAPDSGPVRGAPERSSTWDACYIDTPAMARWLEGRQPRSAFLPPTPTLDVTSEAVRELVALVAGGSARIVLLAGQLRSADEVLAAEDVALRLGAAVFADITSGLRQRPCAVHYADQLLNSPLLAGDLLQIDAIVHIGGPMCSARINAFAKAASPRLYLRVAPVPARLDQDFQATHHLPGALKPLARALASLGLPRARGPPRLWARLSLAAGEELDASLSVHGGFTEPYIAHAVSRLLSAGSHLMMSSSMPIRDMDFFARPFGEGSVLPCQPPVANRGASGIDGVINTAIGYCRGTGACTTLVIGDTASLHDLNALQQLQGPDAVPLTVVLVNNGGGGIFSFLPVARHKDAFSPCFDAPHGTDFAAACAAFGVQHLLCDTAERFQAAFIQAQRDGRTGLPRVIEARVSPSREANVVLHKELGQAVAARTRSELMDEVSLGWNYVLARRAPCAEQPQRAEEGDGVEIPAAPEGPPVLLLHGWLGEKADWASVAQSLVQMGRSVLTVDLPGSGETQVGGVSRDGARIDPWEAGVLFSLPLVVELLANLLERLDIPRVLLAGYSLGGRVAMAFAARHPSRVVGTVALSANPGLASAAARRWRCLEDTALAARLDAMPLSGPEFSGFLDQWYAAPLWAALAERRPEVYRRMLARRRRAVASLTACALRGMSLGRQEDLRPSEAERRRLWYVCGALDQKYAAVAKELAGVKTTLLPDAGHAVVEECAAEVANICADTAWLTSDQSNCVAGDSDEPTSQGESLLLVGAWFRPIELALSAPLLLSRGEPMPHRSGFLIVLEARTPSRHASESGDVRVAGIGEISPLPMFHKETLADVQAQMKPILAAWASKPRAIPASVARLDGSMKRWLDDNCPVTQLLPSVRAGFEMALLHLVARTAKSPHLGVEISAAHGLSCRAAVGINALVAREEDLGLVDATIVKVKVGKSPLEDAQRVEGLAAAFKAQRGEHVRLRLDANQAWSVAEATQFISALSDDTAARIEYIEEPVAASAGPAELVAAWDALAAATQRRVAIAADESLVEGGMTTEHLEACKAPMAALILKPALQGMEQTATLSAWAASHNIRPVLTSAFESGVAMCHFAMLASALEPPAWAEVGHVAPCHGLGTFTRLAEDVLCPPFAELVEKGGRFGWHVDPLACQEALDRTVDALILGRGSNEEKGKRESWF